MSICRKAIWPLGGAVDLLPFPNQHISQWSDKTKGGWSKNPDISDWKQARGAVWLSSPSLRIYFWMLSFVHVPLTSQAPLMCALSSSAPGDCLPGPSKQRTTFDRDFAVQPALGFTRKMAPQPMSSFLKSPLTAQRPRCHLLLPL